MRQARTPHKSKVKSVVPIRGGKRKYSKKITPPVSQTPQLKEEDKDQFPERLNQRVNKGGRPPIMTAEEARRVMSLNCTQAELATFFGVTEQAVIKRMKTDEAFARAVHEGRELGKLSLRRTQKRIADNGSAAMAIFLGKNILGQTDKTEISGEVEQHVTVEVVNNAIRDHLAALREFRLLNTPKELEAPQAIDVTPQKEEAQHA